MPWDSMPVHCFLESCRECTRLHKCQVRVSLIVQRGRQLRHLVDVRGQMAGQVVDTLPGLEGHASVAHSVSRTHYLTVVETPVCPSYHILASSSCFILKETVGAECLLWSVMGESAAAVNNLVEELREGGVMAAVQRMAKVARGRRLTLRQEEVLRSAYDYGFFSSPHGTSVRQLSKALGCSPSTIDRILRTAERKVIAEELRTAESSL